MTRKEYIKLCQNGKTNHLKTEVLKDKSITDPSFARTGRQLIFQPLPIEYRMKYPEGTKLNPDNPHHFNEYDKLYPDQFDAMRAARQDIKDTTGKLNEMQQTYQQQQQQTKKPD